MTEFRFVRVAPRGELPSPLGQRKKLVRYLHGDALIFAGRSVTEDRFDHTHKVASWAYTDGAWVWGDDAAQLIEKFEYGVDPAFLAHARHNGFKVPAVSQTQRSEAEEAVRSLEDDKGR